MYGWCGAALRQKGKRRPYPVISIHIADGKEANISGPDAQLVALWQVIGSNW